MEPFEEMIKKFFEHSDFPNPFDPEGFGRFLQEQIKNALPNEAAIQNQAGGQHAAKQDMQQRGIAPYPMPPQIDRSRIPGMSNARGTRKGTTTGMGNSPNILPAQQPTQQPSQQSPQHLQELNYQAFETHDDLIIRVQIPKDPKLLPKKIKLTSYRITFHNEERHEPLLQIQLPKAVDPDETKWGFRDGILEVKLVKRFNDPVKEFDISTAYRSKTES